MDPNYTESSTSYALGVQRTAYTNPALVRMAIESKEALRKLRFHLSILGDDAPDIHFEPVGSLWLARKSEGDAKKAKLMNAYSKLLIEPYQNIKPLRLVIFGCSYLELKKSACFEPAN